jgi:uncharacterized membrane protein SpoIIM required for sporulation
MLERAFEQKNAPRWNHFETLLTAAEKNNKYVDITMLPKLLQEECNDLSLARHRMYGSNMCEYLNNQVIRGFKVVQRENRALVSRICRFFAADFPRALRAEWRLHILAWLICLIPACVILFSSSPDNMEWVNGVLSEHEKAGLESSYGRGNSMLDEGRGAGQDMMMFGFYVWNNISIDFQIFASGILGGVGSIYYLFHNALSLGAVFAYIHAYGDPSKLYGFVSSHAPYELWAMMISGVAGMRLGFSFLMPGRRSRAGALMDAGKTAVPLILGAASMTFLAAIIEGFWSANPFDSIFGQSGGVTFKVCVGLVGWLLLLVYFSFSGRIAKNEA